MPFNPYDTDIVAQLIAAMNLSVPHQTIVPSSAAGTDYEVPVYVANHVGSSETLTRASIWAASAINASAATTAATLQFRQYRAGSLVGTLTGASTYVTSATLAANAEKSLFSGALVLQPGDMLTLQNSHTGDGKAMPVLLATVETSPSV